MVYQQRDISRRGTLRALASVTDARAGNCRGNVKEGKHDERARACGGRRDRRLTAGDNAPARRDTAAGKMENNGNATCYGYFQEITVMR